jgi:hypothetical protein
MARLRLAGFGVLVNTILLVASLGLLFPESSLAQVAGGTILGTVTDQTGAAVVDARIAISNIKTNIERTATTNGDGFYTVPNLIAGDYIVAVSATGFANTIAKGITLTVGAEQQVNLTLRVGGASDHVEVTESASAVELATSALDGVVNSTEVRELPLNGRDWTQLATLQPGVVTVRTQDAITGGRGQRGFGTQLSISGTRPQQNNYRLDGISINDYANGAPGSALGAAFGVEAIQQFSVLTSNYAAEYGRSSGGVVNAITRSGTNGFHGEAYEFLRNSALDARNFFDPSTKPPFRRDQFGVASGGPIRKDRAFFFANYEGLRQSLGITNVDNVPSQAARNGDLSTGQITVSPLIAPYLAAFYPLPNGPLNGAGDTGKYIVAIQQVTHEDFGTARVDYTISASDSLSGVYLYDSANIIQPDEFRNKLIGYQTTQQFFSLEENHVFSPQLVNSVRIGLNRDVALVSNTPGALNPAAADLSLGFVPGQPAGQIQVPGLTKFTGGLQALTYYDYHWSSIQAYDDAFLTKGLHSIKFGVAIERIRLNMLASNNPNGVFAFGSLANFLTDKPQILTTAIPGTISPRGLRETVVGLYVQDDWRWRPNFTLNLGLRYEMSTVPTEVQGKISTLPSPTDSYTMNHLGDPYFSNPTLRNFDPRIGFAWDPFKNGLTAVRGGFGIYDSLPLPYLVELMSLFAAPFFENAASGTLPAGSFPTGAFSAIANNPATLRYNYIEPHPHRNYVMQWNLNVQRNLGKNVTATVAYVGSRGVHEPLRVDDMDIVLPTLTPQGYLWPSPAGSGTRLNPNVGLINRLTWGGDSYYDALELELQKRMGHGFQIQGSFTWGKSIDDGSASIAGDTFANSQSSLPWYDNRLNRGLSDFNVARNLVVNSTWNIPSIKSVPKLAEWALNGWELGGIFQASDGEPFSVIIGGDPLGEKSSDTTGAADVPSRVAGPGCSSLVNPGQPNNYIRTQCLYFPTPSTLRGNLGRNTLIGPGLATFDFSLFKNNYVPRISESFNVQFRWEIFNLLNRANFAQPLQNNTIFDQSGNPVSGAGQITSTQTSSRQMQFALKVIW